MVFFIKKMSRNSLKWPIWANPPANNRTWQGNDSPDKQWIFYKEVLRGITPPYLWRILRNLKKPISINGLRP